MVIKKKFSIDKRNYALSGQLSFFGRDNLDFKTVNLAKGQKLINLCRVFKLKKIILQKKIFLSYFKIH